MRVVMSQGIEDSTELAKTHPASSGIIDELSESGKAMKLTRQMPPQA